MSGRSPSVWFALFVVFIDALGMGIIMPIMPDLLGQLTGLTVAETAFYSGAMWALYAANQFLFGPVVGALSDKYGRRPLILGCMAALCLDYMLMAVSWSIWVLFVGRFIAGLAGASYSVATAYIADVSPRDKRAANFGLIGAAFGIGFVFGPVLGGLAGVVDVRAPFWLAAALCGVGFGFGLFVLPESLKADNRREFSLASSNPFSSLARAFRLPGMGAFLLVFFLTALSDFTYPAIWSFWGKEAFGWSAAMIGFTLTYYGVGTALVQGGLIRMVVPRLGETRTTIFGLACAGVAALGFGLAGSTFAVLLIIPLACLSHMGQAALVGLMTRQVADSEQGELQGVIGAITAMASIISPIVATLVFYRAAAADAVIYLPGAPFLVAALLMALSFIPLMIAFRGDYRTD